MGLRVVWSLGWAQCCWWPKYQGAGDAGNAGNAHDGDAGDADDVA